MRHLRTSSIATLCLTAVLCGALTSCKKPAPATFAVPEGAVVVRKFDADLTKRFSFARTIGQILTTAGIQDTQANREALVKTMLASFNSNQLTNPLSGLAMPVAPRPNESGFSPADLLNPGSAVGMHPIGLFNRLDLAPADWKDCGEHRIVYEGGGPSRFFIIFEAKLPNPKPAKGKKGCRPVAQRWADIGAAASAADRNNLLDEFYYGHLPGGFRSVVDFLNYGAFLGQVRTNILGLHPWQLREFRVLPVTIGHLAFIPAPVASNPLSSFYANNPIGPSLEQSLRTQFQSRFAANYQNNLKSVDQTEAASTPDPKFKEKLMNAMGAGFEFQFNEFQSNSEAFGETPAAKAGTAVRSTVPASWSSPVGSRTVSQAELLNRAGAVTCAGCHQLSNGAPIGKLNGATIAWPSSAGFVHISEQTDSSGNHVISQALSQFFLPFRRKVTDDILNTTTAMIEPRSEIRLASLIVGEAHAQPALERARGAAPTREQAEQAALNLVQGKITTANAQQAATELRHMSDLAHAEEQATPGAYVQFRRPH